MSLQTLYIKTYGCQMNAYDSSKMADILRDQHNIQLTDQPENADILLLNTCSVREKAQEKVFSDLGRWREFKQQKPHVVIGVGGCVASQEGATILARAPYVDLIFGPQTLHRLPQMLAQLRTTKKSVVDISFPEIEKFDNLPTPKAEGVTAFVSIMEGCSKYCSFCVVPYTRGEEISRPLDDVILEVARLAEQGVREITLLGQNVNDYRGLQHNGEIADLALLIRYVAAIESIKRIRFMTSHPLAFSDSLIQVFADVPKLANYLHLPVQSGSDHVLAAMKRGYTVLEFKSKVRKLRKVRPSINLTSDFIVGFPGESEADFQATVDLVHEIGFDYSYSFLYSKRPGTPAAQFADDVSIEIKKQRLAILQQRLQQQGDRISEAMVGSVQHVLVEGSSKLNIPQQLSGRTDNNRVVNFTVPVEQRIALIGQMVNIRITEALHYTLRGELIS